MLAEKIRAFHNEVPWTRPHADHSSGVAQCRVEETVVEHKLLSNTPLIIVFLQGKDSYGYISPPELIVIDKMLQTDKVWPVSPLLMSPVSLSRFVRILQDKVGVHSNKVRTDLSWQHADLDLAPVPSCGALDTHPHPEHSSGVGQNVVELGKE